ncbi:MAG: amidohydrolase family protein [Sphingomicrobium sp.]
MNKTFIALVAALLASPALADTLIYNINGIQVSADGKLQHFTGLVVGNDGKVAQIVRRDTDLKRPIEHEIDGHGRTLLPGLIDAHGHVTALGTAAMTLQLSGSSSLADVQQRLRAYASAHRDKLWIIGFGWNQELWPDKSFPTAADLDAVVSDRPVVLERVDGHAIVANSAALRAAGVTAATRDLAGGKVERDAKGNPTGLFVDKARSLVERAIPPQTATDEDQALDLAQEQLLSLGVTAVGSMSTSMDDWQAFRRAGETGRLRVRLMSYMNAPEAAQANAAPTPWLYGDRLRLIGVKLFADGALGSRGAWLKQPYADKPDTRGLPRRTDAEFMAMADAAAARGFQLATHAIGDAANAQVIGAYEQLHRKYPGNRRWRIEHFQIADPIDIPRLAPSGIIASMQPTHQTSDRLMAEKRLGPNRLGGAYAWNTIRTTGAHLAFGSDFPVESPNPFPGLAAAISRQDMNGQPPGGWRPEERVSFETALAGFTREAAYASFAEDRVGALEPDKWADFILVDRDPTKVDAQQLARTEVLETWVAGQKIWARALSAAATERGK